MFSTMTLHLWLATACAYIGWHYLRSLTTRVHHRTSIEHYCTDTRLRFATLSIIDFVVGTYFIGRAGTLLIRVLNNTYF